MHQSNPSRIPEILPLPIKFRLRPYKNQKQTQQPAHPNLPLLRGGCDYSRVRGAHTARPRTVNPKLGRGKRLLPLSAVSTEARDQEASGASAAEFPARQHPFRGRRRITRSRMREKPRRLFLESAAREGSACGGTPARGPGRTRARGRGSPLIYRWKRLRA